MQKDIFVYRHDLKTTVLASFLSGKLNYTTINLFLQKLSNLNFAKFTVSTRADVTLHISVKQLANTMCSAVTPDCGYDNGTNTLIGEVFCPNTKRSGKFCVHKKTFQSPSRDDYQCPQCASVCKCAVFLLKMKQVPFSCRSARGSHFRKESKINSTCCSRCLLSWQVLLQQRAKRIAWRLCNRSQIHSWLGKVWSLLVCSQSLIYGTGARKDDKNRQNTFSLRQKKINLLPDKQLFNNVPVQSSK